MTSANAPGSDRPATPPTHAAQLRRALTGFLPITAWLPTCSRTWLRGDLMAGATLVGLAVPESLGYAQIAGAPVQLGLYALFGGLIGYALFGSSGQLVVGPSAALAAISAALIGDLAPGGSAKHLALTVGLALVTGVVALLSGLLLGCAIGGRWTRLSPQCRHLLARCRQHSAFPRVGQMILCQPGSDSVTTSKGYRHGDAQLRLTRAADRRLRQRRRALV